MMSTGEGAAHHPAGRGEVCPRSGVVHPVSHRQFTMANMLPHGHSTPSSTGGPCWHCTQFAGLVYAGSAARCTMSPGTKVRSMPASGCAFWLREIGADDEPGPPAVFDAVPVLLSMSVPAQAVEWAP